MPPFGLPHWRAEGVVAKQRASIDHSSWVKVKCPAWREADRNRGDLFGEARDP
jgi:hypothetical protein